MTFSEMLPHSTSASYRCCSNLVTHPSFPPEGGLLRGRDNHLYFIPPSPAPILMVFSEDGILDGFLSFGWNCHGSNNHVCSLVSVHIGTVVPSFSPTHSSACPQSATSSRKPSLFSQIQGNLFHGETPFVVNCLFPCVRGKQSYTVYSPPLPSVPSKLRGSLPGLGLPQGQPLGLPTRARHIAGILQIFVR